MKNHVSSVLTIITTESLEKLLSRYGKSLVKCLRSMNLHIIKIWSPLPEKSNLAVDPLHYHVHSVGLREEYTSYFGTRGYF